MKDEEKEIGPDKPWQFQPGNQGIYKITSPTGRVYVGQSIDIKSRFQKYKCMWCHGQKRLYNSLKKYGVCLHVFVIIEECNEEIMNERERHYQEIYDVLGSKGLNSDRFKERETF